MRKDDSAEASGTMFDLLTAMARKPSPLFDIGHVLRQQVEHWAR